METESGDGGIAAAEVPVDSARRALEGLRSAERLLVGATGALRYVIDGPPAELMIPTRDSHRVTGAERDAEVLRATTDTLEARKELLGALALLEVPPESRPGELAALGVPQEMVDGSCADRGPAELLRIIEGTRDGVRQLFGAVHGRSAELQGLVEPLAEEPAGSDAQVDGDALRSLMPGRLVVYAVVGAAVLFLVLARCLFEGS